MRWSNVTVDLQNRLGLSRFAGWIAAAMVVAVLAAAALANYLTWAAGHTPDIEMNSFSAGVAVFTLVGSIIVWRQSTNRIGWVFAAIGLLWVTGDLALRYSTYVHVTGRGNDVLAFLGAWYGEWYWFAFLILTFSLLPQLFPSGDPMPGRWSFVARAVGLFTLATVVLTMFEDELVLVGTNDVIHNPFGIPGFHDIEEGPLAGIVLIGGLISIAAGAAAIVVRFRRSRGEERQQLKWFTFAAIALVVQFVVQSATSGEEGHRLPWLDGIALALVPMSAAIAIFRYRLYDIDVVINRALVYGGLSTVLAGAYLGLVVVLQGLLSPVTADSDVAVAGSTLAVAALFRPARERIQEFIDRRFYRHKYDAAETLDEFATTLRDEVDLDSLSRQLVDVVSNTMQPAHASLWLRSESAQ